MRAVRPAREAIVVGIDCEPVLAESKGIAAENTIDDAEQFTVDADAYNTGTDTSAFNYVETLNGTSPWFVDKTGITEIDCESVAASQIGESMPLSDQHLTAQITPTTVNKLHVGSGTVIAPVVTPATFKAQLIKHLRD